MQDVIGAVLTIAVGLGILATPFLNRWFERRSYDLSFRIRPSIHVDDVVFVVMDGASRKALAQSDEKQWDRQLHAKLLDQLMARGAKAVLFTTVFSEPSSDPRSDQALDQALRRARGKAVLSGAISSDTVRGPIPALAGAAPWGVQIVSMDHDGVCRNLSSGAKVPTAASRVALALNRSATNAVPPRWLNYYSAVLPAIIMRYEHALRGDNNLAAVKGRLVVVTSDVAESTAFGTPFFWRSDRRFTRADLEATASLNLVRVDGLSRMAPRAELSVLLGGGGFVGLLLMGRHRRRLVLAAIFSVLVVVVASQLLLTQLHVWFSWLVLVGAQIPLAAAWAWFCSSLELPAVKFARRAVMQGERGGISSDARTPASEEQGSLLHGQPAIPDHTLARRIGRGAYGEVWLARNVIGRYQAVKIVKASSFSQSTPYEREFRGIERFASVSRNHPGLVQVLHIGRNDANGYFFYIMELADDANASASFDPERYVAKTLAGELERRGHLPVREVVQIGIALTSALEHLHERQLVHRDIKPSNIIFVDGQVKIADIGLVAAIAYDQASASRVGTDGYIAPEGPGTPSADLYALGKVLYEIGMGRDRWQFPELPTTIGVRPDEAALRRLHEIILNACDDNPAHRFLSAKAFREALMRVNET